MASVNERFPVPERRESFRLFFAKDSQFSLVWHILDAKLFIRYQDGMGYYIALHGHESAAVVRADSVLSVRIQLKNGEQFCARCLEEYELAKDLIDANKLLKFR